MRLGISSIAMYLLSRWTFFREFSGDLGDSGYYEVSRPWNQESVTSWSTCYISVPAYCYALCKLTSQFTLAKPTRSAGDRKDGSLRTHRGRDASSGYARTAYIRDEMLRAYFRYQGRCCEINRSLNKSYMCARARARIGAGHGLRRGDRRSTRSVNFVKLAPVANRIITLR